MHSLRHSLANELLRKEIPLPVIAEILGHKSLKSTMQYLRSDVEQLRYCTLVEGDNYAT
jgi:site-specific recombinase XerD